VTLPRAKHFDYAAVVGRDGAIGAEGSAPVTLPPELTPEHLVLAGLGRCAIASLEYHAERAGVAVAAAATASGSVTRRPDDERYAFVRIECALDAELVPAPAPEAVVELVAKAERDCFIAASLRVTPSYRWRINGEEIE
jgi:organic hydroperoxide reductase OsmC/OhrA